MTTKFERICRAYMPRLINDLGITALAAAAVQAAEAAAGDANTFYIDGHALVSADAANFVDEIHYSDAGASAAATALDAII